MSGFFYFASCFKYILTKNISEEDMVKFFTSQVFFFLAFSSSQNYSKIVWGFVFTVYVVNK